MRNDISRLQLDAGRVLQGICAVLQISREDFSSVLAKHLRTEPEKETGPAEETVLAYLRKLPQKYLRNDGFSLFRAAVEKTVQDLCNGEGPCTVDKRAVSDSWNKYRGMILSSLDDIHQQAVEVQIKIFFHEN